MHRVDDDARGVHHRHRQRGGRHRSRRAQVATVGGDALRRAVVGVGDDRLSTHVPVGHEVGHAGGEDTLHVVVGAHHVPPGCSWAPPSVEQASRDVDRARAQEFPEPLGLRRRVGPTTRHPPRGGRRPRSSGPERSRSSWRRISSDAASGSSSCRRSTVRSAREPRVGVVGARTRSPTFAFPPLSPERAPHTVPERHARRVGSAPDAAPVARARGDARGSDGDRSAAPADPDDPLLTSVGQQRPRARPRSRGHQRRPVDAVLAGRGRGSGGEEARVARQRERGDLVGERAADGVAVGALRR